MTVVARLTSLAAYFVAVGLAIGVAPARATDIGWRTTGTQTSSNGNHYTREGTAVFTTGEEAHVAVDGFLGPDVSNTSGTARGEAVYQFKDGSSFTLRFVSIWTGAMSRNAGIFAGGTGRFAGMTGTGTAANETADTTGPMVTVWTGTYELSPK
jgi:hypothetical protein